MILCEIMILCKKIDKENCTRFESTNNKNNSNSGENFQLIVSNVTNNKNNYDDDPPAFTGSAGSDGTFEIVD